MQTILSISEMKYTKDNVNNQMLPADIDAILALYKANYPQLKYIDIAIPLNSNDEFVTNGNKPSPLTVEAYEALWIKKIQDAGYLPLLRGTFCDAEGIYNFPINKQDGAYWQAKVMAWVKRVSPLLNRGAIIAILPESTNNAFNGNMFLTGQLPDAYNLFFTNLITTLQTQLSGLGIEIYITNNFTELQSGWIGATIPTAMQATIMDDYGSEPRPVAGIQADIEAMKAKFGFPVGLQEWADIDGQGAQYTANMVAMFLDEIAKGNLFMVNLWCGWAGGKESILTNTNGVWALNDSGRALIPFFAKPTPPPVTPGKIPAFNFTGTLVSDGKGNISFTVKQN